MCNDGDFIDLSEYANSCDEEDNKKSTNSDEGTVCGTLYGWICPRCGTCNAPHICQCSCSPPLKFSTGTSDSQYF